MSRREIIERIADILEEEKSCETCDDLDNCNWYLDCQNNNFKHWRPREK